MKIGVLGGGQLAAMMAQAGLPMGLDFVFLDPAVDACAGRYGLLLNDRWSNASGRAELLACDALTCDFENVPAEVLAALADSLPVRPGPAAFAAAQDRLTEKRLFEQLDIPFGALAAVSSRPELLSALDRIGYPAVLKTRRLGYDGKGQAILRSPEDLEPAWARLGDQPLVLEAWVAFRHECAVTAVRSAAGEIRVYPPSWTVHRGGILRLAYAPAPIDPEQMRLAEQHLTRLMTELDYVGCLTLEYFVTDQGLLANEFAPRVHNSAHWTIEAAVTSQFANHVRAVADLPLGDTRMLGQALMLNWVGALPDQKALMNLTGLAWHDYRKAGRPGRKVGHATLVAPDPAQMAQAIGALRASGLDADWDELLDKALPPIG